MYYIWQAAWILKVFNPSRTSLFWRKSCTILWYILIKNKFLYHFLKQSRNHTFTFENKLYKLNKHYHFCKHSRYRLFYQIIISWLFQKKMVQEFIFDVLKYVPQNGIWRTSTLIIFRAYLCKKTWHYNFTYLQFYL